MCRFSSQILIKMTEQEFYRKTDECIASFKNGKERYKTSATFNRVVQMLVRDADPYEIIDHLCQMSDDQTKALQQADVIKSVCNQCKFESECRFKTENIEQNCKFFIDKQTVL